MKICEWSLWAAEYRSSLARLAARLWEMGFGTPEFLRRRGKWIWEKLLEILIVDPDVAWLMIGASHVKVHPHAAGARGESQGMAKTTKIHLAVDAHGMPVRIVVTEGTWASGI